MNFFMPDYSFSRKRKSLRFDALIERVCYKPREATPEYTRSPRYRPRFGIRLYRVDQAMKVGPRAIEDDSVAPIP
jgi:hypothetical protein